MCYSADSVAQIELIREIVKQELTISVSICINTYILHIQYTLGSNK